MTFLTSMKTSLRKNRMFGIEFMTAAERKGTLEEIKSLEEACKVDADEVLRAMSDFDADVNLCIHINMLKCEVLQEMKKPVIPLKAEDYAEICKLDVEEARRNKLVEILISKEKEEIKAMFKGDKKMYEAAVDLIRENQRISVSFVQRKLKISFNTASAIIEQLQTDGIVSAPDSNGRREVLVGPKANPNLGKVLKRKDNPDEPVLAPVASIDAEVGGIAVDRLRSLIERIERLQEEAQGIASDIRDVFAEAKSAGFDVKIMRMILKLRKMNAADRDEQEVLLETYRKALDI